MSPGLARAARGAGWLLITCGALVGLYLAYSLLFTNLENGRAQQSLGDQWAQQVGPVADGVAEGAQASAGEVQATGGGRRPLRVDPGEALAVLQFRRPGSDRAVVHDGPLYVVEGVGVPELQRGPGHYPDSGPPGGDGNFAVAGHRTTYGAPFFHLDQLRRGDQVLVTDRRGTRSAYRVLRQQVVAPTDAWVIDRNPLDRGRPLLTLTTCNPRFSDAQRLVVFAELAT